MPLVKFSLALVTIAIVFIVYLVLSQTANQKSEKQKATIDSLQRRSDSLQILVDTLTAPLTPALLQYKLEIVAKRHPWGKEFASYFTAIAIKESGDKFTKGAVQKTNCPFGFHYRPNNEYVATFYENGYGETFSCYLSLEDALCDALKWVLFNPPTENECFDTAYLRRRAYNNSCKNYYSDIESLRLPNYIKNE